MNAFVFPVEWQELFANIFQRATELAEPPLIINTRL